MDWIIYEDIVFLLIIWLLNELQGAPFAAALPFRQSRRRVKRSNRRPLFGNVNFASPMSSIVVAVGSSIYYIQMDSLRATAGINGRFPARASYKREMS